MPTIKNGGRWLLLMGFIAAAVLSRPEAGWAQEAKPVTLQVRPMLKISVIIKPGGGGGQEC